MQRNKAVITDLSEAVDSPTGWIYCLKSKCGEYSKIGKTINPVLSVRIGKTKRTYYSEMDFAWAIQDCRKERAAHSLLVDKRCSFKKSRRVSSVSDYSIEKTADFPVCAPSIELFKESHDVVLSIIEAAGLIELADISEWDARPVKNGADSQKVLSFAQHILDEIEKHPNQTRFITNLIERHIAEREAAAQIKPSAVEVQWLEPKHAYSIFDFMQGKSGISAFAH